VDVPASSAVVSPLVIDEHVLRAAARARAGADPVTPFLKRFVAERWMRHRRGIRFRRRRNGEARAAYAAMTAAELSAINACQRWANWRTIPRNLSRRIPNRALRALDLCCGVGDSTEVLAFHLPSGSTILGLELSPRFVSEARSRRFAGPRGGRADVRFTAQSVLETFRDETGRALADESVDLVNCSGAVGCHFDPGDTEVLAAEVARVLRPNGLAQIDAGGAGTGPDALARIFERQGFVALNVARSCFLDRYVQVAFRKQAEL
jgi:SAM-dependent methyltransferase